MRVDLKIIKDLVEVETGIKDISIKTRDQVHVDARVLYYILAREKAKVGYDKMAKFINKNHATALHSYKNIYNEWKMFPKDNSNNLNSLNKLIDIVDNDLNSFNDDISIKKLFLKYKRRNTLLYKENISLRKDIERLEKQVNVLKKYAPIW